VENAERHINTSAPEGPYLTVKVGKPMHHVRFYLKDNVAWFDPE
jgi:hypothetical protein